jgi:hypothetical protein
VVVESKALFSKKKIMTNNLATSELKTTGIDKASIPKQATIKNIVPSTSTSAKMAS